MGIFSKLKFWGKKDLPDLSDPTPDFTPPPQLPLEEPRPQFQEQNPFHSPPQFEEPIHPQASTNSEFQVISSKLDVLNAKLEVLNERLSNIEKNLDTAKVKW